jgi:hypothetical protein
MYLETGIHRRRWKSGLEFGNAGVVFDCHVFKLTGVKDFSAFLALYKFRVFLPCNYAHARMLADLFHADSLRWKFGRCGMGSVHIREFLGPIREIVALPDAMSSV